MKSLQFLRKLYVILAALSLTACLTPSTQIKSTASTSAATNTTLSGPKAAKIIFKQASPTGSFDASPAGGTVPTPGSGQQAVRVFNADGSLLASGTTSSSWPQWLSSVEIGISGANNTAATNPDCARFATALETGNCHFDGNGAGATTPCSASAGLYRVSEYDCAQAAPTDGTGGPGDGVYIRAVFNRNYLASTENLMAVLEYSASALNAAPASPVSCFTGGNFTPETCSDMTWRVYVKHTASEVVQPFLLLVPPAFAHVNTSTNTGGSGVSAKQFYIPLSGDSTLSVVQISRIKALTVSPTYTTICSNGALPANSPLCVGMIFYSLTFYRM